jgi:hypothetical protein
MKLIYSLQLLIAVAAATSLLVDDVQPLQRRQLGKGKGKGKGKSSSSPGPGKGGNDAMKNGWAPVTKSPGGRAEPCLKPEDCDYSHLTMNDLINGPCKKITFIFARATTEQGNMVSSTTVVTFVANQGQGAAAGTGVARYLSGHYGVANVAVQGVKYPADIGGNMAAGGCSKTGINEAVRLFNLANTKCPKTIITAGGYSQGTACIHRSIPKLSAAVKAKIGKYIYGVCYNCLQVGYDCPQIGCPY